MANHIRQQIREYFGTNLTGLSTTGFNVYESRVYPIENSKLPALVIYTKSETSEPIVIGTDRVMSRELSVVVEGYAKATSNFDDTIDTISKEVEEAIAADRTLGGLAKDIYLESTQIDFNAEGEKPLGFVSLTFISNYYVKEKNPDVAV
jgi:flagellar basal body rod protein FlgF